MDDERARQLLSAEMERLTEIRSGVVAESDDPGGFDEAGGQPSGDAGSETQAASLGLGILEDIERELREVEDALRRLDEGTYGMCEGCGKPIPDERLEALPTARYDVEHEPKDRL